MKLRSTRRTATVLTIAVDVLRVFFPFFTDENRHPMQRAPVQRYFESVIAVTEKVVTVKWGGI
ncbi:MAG: hypothetical protein ABSF44_11625 [Candidatus Bathyarchaeia archaeon]|jgi:ribosomal protein L31